MKRPLKEPLSKICAHCGCSFSQRRYLKGLMKMSKFLAQKHCTLACRISALNARPKPIPRAPKICVIDGCGKVVRFKYCSKQCAAKDRRALYGRRHPPLPAKACAKCQSVFAPRHKKQIYCSQACKSRALHLRFYYQNNAKWQEIRRRYHAKHGDEIRASQKSYRQANSEKFQEYRKNYYHLNKARFYNQKHVRRAREATPIQEAQRCIAVIQKVSKARTHTCYYCRKQFRGSAHVDHIVALAKGGKHEVSNLCVSCGPCNLSKAVRAVSDLGLAEPVFAF